MTSPGSASLKDGRKKFEIQDPEEAGTFLTALLTSALGRPLPTRSPKGYLHQNKEALRTIPRKQSLMQWHQ